MKALLMSFNQLWCVVIPPTESLFPDFDIQNNPEKFAMPIYKVNKIMGTENWKLNQEVEGDIVRENRKNYFVLKGVQYMEPITEQNSRTLTLIKGIMGNYSQVALTLDQYNYIQDVAKSENLISSYFSNGFCVNYKYVVFGKLTQDKKIIYPQIKIKQKNE